MMVTNNVIAIKETQKKAHETLNALGIALVVGVNDNTDYEWAEFGGENIGFHGARPKNGPRYVEPFIVEVSSEYIFVLGRTMMYNTKEILTAVKQHVLQQAMRNYIVDNHWLPVTDRVSIRRATREELLAAIMSKGGQTIANGVLISLPKQPSPAAVKKSPTKKPSGAPSKPASSKPDSLFIGVKWPNGDVEVRSRNKNSSFNMKRTKDDATSIPKEVIADCEWLTVG